MGLDLMFCYIQPKSSENLVLCRRVCDADVAEIGSCQTAVSNPKNRGIWSIGAVGRCLSRQLAESKPLTLDCRSLVIVAAPKVCVPSFLPWVSPGQMGCADVLCIML